MEMRNTLPDIRKVRVLEEPIDKVWKSISTSEGIALWFVDNDFAPVEGHIFYMDMHKPQGKTDCKVTRVEPQTRLVYKVGQDWSWTFELKDLSQRTELTFIWSGWESSKRTEFGVPHTEIHGQLMEGTDVLMNSMSRAIRKIGARKQGNATPSGRENRQQAILHVSGMACENCARSVEKALHEIGASGKVQLKHKLVNVDYDESVVSLEAVKDAILDLGYEIKA
ncbi:cation transporter [Paenibacillus arenilitoris]|uniref:Cation transporter n=1 Tax=Paenibacillus arenilitoris TaxID=2772299 RepID=A0A927H8U8_9BACL|nr:cation transporter [Paenibacillus arenilitoris]MBD2870979.1 cation transporter [Paenibacillus arenilitoris]